MCLAALAGYIDALGFLSLGGFFISFMSGNSTRMSVGISQGTTDAFIAAGLIGTFLLGVILGSLAGHAAKARRRTVVLGFVTLLLTAAAGLSMAGAVRPAIIAMGLAMGAENAIFERDGEVHIGLTYMTGTLVKLGQRITSALLGGDHRLAWISYLLLWLGLVTGALIGAFVFPVLKLNGLWVAAAASGVLTITAGMIDRDIRLYQDPAELRQHPR